MIEKAGEKGKATIRILYAFQLAAEHTRLSRVAAAEQSIIPRALLFSVCSCTQELHWIYRHTKMKHFARQEIKFWVVTKPFFDDDHYLYFDLFAV